MKRAPSGLVAQRRNKKKMSDIYVSRFLRSIYMYDKTLSNRIDFNDDSECSSEEEQREIKQEVKQDDCNTSTDY